MKSTKNAPKKRRAKNQPLKAAEKQPFLEHVHELRRRLFYIGISVTVFSCAAYAIEHSIVNALLKPAKHQEFIYTTPGGGLDFLFRLCLYVGIICSIPVIVYQILRYLEPLLKINTRRAVATGSIASGVLAAIGMVFGYFIGLPAAMHFLMHQFMTPQIQPLLTIQSYMSFVMVYMLGSALLLQVPLVLIIINRIKPLKPQKLLSLQYERWVIVLGFVGGALMNPSPNLMAQLIVVVPIILAYQVGVLLVWITNHNRPSSEQLSQLRGQDEELRAVRLQTAQNSKSIQPVLANIPVQPHPTRAIAAHVKPRPIVSAKPADIMAPIKETNAAAYTHKSQVKSAAVIPQKPIAKGRLAGTPIASNSTAHLLSRPGMQRRYISDFTPRRTNYAAIRPLAE